MMPSETVFRQYLDGLLFVQIFNCQASSEKNETNFTFYVWKNRNL